MHTLTSGAIGFTQPCKGQCEDLPCTAAKQPLFYVIELYLSSSCGHMAQPGGEVVARMQACTHMLKGLAAAVGVNGGLVHGSLRLVGVPLVEVQQCEELLPALAIHNLAQAVCPPSQSACRPLRYECTLRVKRHSIA